MPGIDGVDFAAAWERRVEGVIDTERDLRAFFISKEDLIVSKLAAGGKVPGPAVEDLRQFTPDPP